MYNKLIQYENDNKEDVVMAKLVAEIRNGKGETDHYEVLLGGSYYYHPNQDITLIEDSRGKIDDDYFLYPGQKFDTVEDIAVLFNEENQFALEEGRLDDISTIYYIQR